MSGAQGSRVIDAHQHFWRAVDKTNALWRKSSGDSLLRDFGPEDLSPDLHAAGVDGTVVIQSLNEEWDTQDLLRLAKRHDSILGVVGWADLTAPETLATRLQRLEDDGWLRGLRHLPKPGENEDWLLRSEVVQSVERLAVHGLVLDTVPTTERELSNVIELARRVPQTPIIIDHLGRPPLLEAGWEPWASLMTDAAGLGNVSLKVSAGLAVVTNWKRWSAKEFAPYFGHTCTVFGAERLMFASNWPVVLLAGSYGHVVEQTYELLSFLDPAERASVLGGTADRVYGLGQI